MDASRLRAYCLILLIVSWSLLALAFVRRPDGLTLFGTPLGGDFIAFYSAGLLPNPYDLKVQNQTVHEIVPESPVDRAMPYLNPPFFSLLFVPLAKLPFAWAYFVWLLLSVSLFIGAVLLALQSQPSLARGLSFLVALAFPPFAMFSLQGGQVAAFGCFILAFAFYLSKKNSLLSGLVLSLMLYKPPLLLFLVPMLLVRKEWRILAGFICGSTLLVAVSWLVVGTSGMLAYFHLLKTFYQLNNSTAEVFQSTKYVDVGAALRLLVGPIPAVRFVLLISAFGFLLWRRFGSHPWALALIATLLLSLYTPIYDCSLLVLAIIWVGPTRIGARILVALFIISLVTFPIAQFTHIQFITPMMALLAWRLLPRNDQDHAISTIPTTASSCPGTTTPTATTDAALAAISSNARVV